MDLIVTSGGLGPTADDLTAEVVGALRRARAGPRRGDAGEDRGDPAPLRRALSTGTRRRCWRPTASRRWCPRGRSRSTRRGRRPGWSSRPGSGSSSSCRGRRASCGRCGSAALATEPVREVLARSTPLHAYTMRMFGVPESEIAKSLREIEAEDGVDVWQRSRSRPACAAARSRSTSATATRRRRSPRRSARALAARHRARDLQPRRRDDRRQVVAGLLRGRELGLAESCSGGLLAARITDLPGASEYMAGSVVSYSNEAKSELLGVDPGLIEARGAVSPEVAEAMAIGALERFDADVAVSITGIAGPDGGSEEKPVGYVCFNARLADGTVDRARSGDPGRARRHPRTLGADRDAPAADPAERRRGAVCRRDRAIGTLSCVKGAPKFTFARCSVRRGRVAWRPWQRKPKRAAGAPVRRARPAARWSARGSRPGARRELPDPALRRVPAESLHVTLAFLGHRPRGRGRSRSPR